MEYQLWSRATMKWVYIVCVQQNLDIWIFQSLSDNSCSSKHCFIVFGVLFSYYGIVTYSLFCFHPQQQKPIILHLPRTKQQTNLISD